MKKDIFFFVLNVFVFSLYGCNCKQNEINKVMNGTTKKVATEHIYKYLEHFDIEMTDNYKKCLQQKDTKELVNDLGYLRDIFALKSFKAQKIIECGFQGKRAYQAVKYVNGVRLYF